MAMPHQTSEEFDRLLAQLVATANRGSIPAGFDADDLAAEALLAVAAEPQSDENVPLVARARRKLLDRRAEIFRFRGRRDEPPKLELLEHVPDGRDDVALNDLLVWEAVGAVLGHEGKEYIEYKCQDMTASDIADLHGWDAQRVERVGKRVRRAKGQLLDTLLEDD